MKPNKNLDRWIYTTIVKHFSHVAQEHDIPLFIERADREIDWVELRLNGPFIDHPSKTCLYLTVNVDILITCFVGNNKYLIHYYTGIFQSAFVPLCVYRYGDNEEDDHSLVGLLKLTDEKLNTTNYGLIYPENRFFRASVETDYILQL